MVQPNRQSIGSTLGPAAVGAAARATEFARLQQSDLFRGYQEAFEAATGLPLVLRESGSFRTPLQGSKLANPFCALMTQANQTCAACLQLQQQVEAEATLEPKTLECYAGLSETAVPVRVGHHLLGYLQTGQVFLRTPSGRRFSALMRMNREGQAGGDPRELESAYFRTRVVTRKQYESIVRLLAIFAAHLAAVSNSMLLKQATTESPMIAKVRTFIAEHQGEQLHLDDAARAANVSVFYFCKIFKEATGLTFTEYLSRGRIETVKQLLHNVHTRVSEAAFAAGFQSLSQFNRVFRRVAGESPGRYRNRLHESNDTAVPAAAFVRVA